MIEISSNPICADCADRDECEYAQNLELCYEENEKILQALQKVFKENCRVKSKEVKESTFGFLQ